MLPAASFTSLQIAKAYNFPTTVNGKGQTIGIIELGGGFTQSDLNTYFSGLNISPAPTVVAVSVDGAQNQPTGDTSGPDTEVMLDIEVAGAVAPGARIVVYFAPNTDAGFLDAINQAAMDKVNSSFGDLDQLGRAGVELDGTILADLQQRPASGGGAGRDGVRGLRRQRFRRWCRRRPGPRGLPLVQSVLAGMRRHHTQSQRQFDFQRSRMERSA